MAKIMEQMIAPIEKIEFKHIIEFEINRLDAGNRFFTIQFNPD